MSNKLKKEFKKADVERMRNLIKKDYTASTKSQIGYKKTYTVHKEGEVWEENGKQWVIKNGIKQNVTKFDAAKKAMQTPLTCPKCSGPMNYYLSKETYKKSKMCFNCYMAYTEELRKNGLFEDYIRSVNKGNIKYFIKAFEQKIEHINNSSKQTFVTEQGDIEDWKSNETETKRKITKELQEYIEFLKLKLE